MAFDPDAYLAQPAAPAAAAFDPDAYLRQPSIGADVAKSAGIGLVKGALGTVGAAGDTRSLGNRIIDAAGEKIGAPSWLTTGLKGINNVGSLLTNPGSIATSGDLQNSVEQLTGKFYAPQTTPGHYAETVASFVPAALGGEGALVPRLVRQALIPGLASEAAGQATAGSALEPYARAAAAIGAGGAAQKVASSRAAAAAAKANTPTIGEAKKAASALFEAPEVKDVTFTPGTIEGVANMVGNDLRRARFNDRIAPQTHALLDDMKTPVDGSTHTLEDVRTTRTLLGRLGGNFADPLEKEAATQAIKTLDKMMLTMPQSRVATGDIAAANAKLADAAGNYASAKTAERVAEKLRDADLQAASTYAGGNLNNATRQKLRGLLTNPKQSRGLTPDELQSIEDTVRGSAAGNAMRAAGKLLGGGGGWGTVATGAAGHVLGGPLLAAAIPATGFVAKKIGDALTRRNSSKIVSQILPRSPLGMQRAAANPVPPQQLHLLKALLLANAAILPARLQPAPQLTGANQ